jgi:glycosyltransferase involved in cell wall biosynthesis
VDVRIVGGGFEWDALRQLSIETGADANITWLGDINDRRQIVSEFKRCHVFVHPSIQDAFANVCLEAMASSRPLVVSDAASMPELVRPAGSSSLVPPEDPEALAQAIGDLLADDEKQRQFGRAGRRFAESMRWENTASRFLALIR